MMMGNRLMAEAEFRSLLKQAEGTYLIDIPIHRLKPVADKCRLKPAEQGQ